MSVRVCVRLCCRRYPACRQLFSVQHGVHMTTTSEGGHRPNKPRKSICCLGHVLRLSPRELPVRLWMFSPTRRSDVLRNDRLIQPERQQEHLKHPEWRPESTIPVTIRGSMQKCCCGYCSSFWSSQSRSMVNISIRYLYVLFEKADKLANKIWILQNI